MSTAAESATATKAATAATKTTAEAASPPTECAAAAEAAAASAEAGGRIPRTILILPLDQSTLGILRSIAAIAGRIVREGLLYLLRVGILQVHNGYVRHFGRFLVHLFNQALNLIHHILGRRNPNGLCALIGDRDDVVVLANTVVLVVTTTTGATRAAEATEAARSAATATKEPAESAAATTEATKPTAETYGSGATVITLAIALVGKHRSEQVSHFIGIVVFLIEDAHFGHILRVAPKSSEVP